MSLELGIAQNCISSQQVRFVNKPGDKKTVNYQNRPRKTIEMYSVYHSISTAQTKCGSTIPWNTQPSDPDETVLYEQAIRYFCWSVQSRGFQLLGKERSCPLPINTAFKLSKHIEYPPRKTQTWIFDTFYQVSAAQKKSKNIDHRDFKCYQQNTNLNTDPIVECFQRRVFFRQDNEPPIVYRTALLTLDRRSWCTSSNCSSGRTIGFAYSRSQGGTSGKHVTSEAKVAEESSVQFSFYNSQYYTNVLQFWFLTHSNVCSENRQK